MSLPLNASRVVHHEGRRHYFTKESAWKFHEADPTDEHFELDTTNHDEANFHNYSM